MNVLSEVVYLSCISPPVRLCLPGVVGVLSEAVFGLTFPRSCSAHQLSWVCCKRLYPGRTLAPALLRSSDVVDMLTESGHAYAKMLIKNAVYAPFIGTRTRLC